jgi:flagellar FliL protein
MADIPVLEAAPKGDKKADKKADKDKAEKKPAAAAGDAAPAAAGGKKKLIIFIAIGVAVLGGLGAGAYFMFGGKHEDAKGKKQSSAQKEEKEEAPKGPPLFVALDPPFVVNFQAEQAVRFLQVSAQIMSRDLETIELLKTSDPIIRNDMLLLLGNQSYQSVSTLEGKEKLRSEALEVVRKVIAQNGGKAKDVEAVYFTSFVMQ